jgi:hypothetical protein
MRVKFKLDYKYAVAEVLLITVGILLALGIDQWRDSEADRAMEADYVSRFQQDLAADLNSLEFWIGVMESKRSFIASLIAGDFDAPLEEQEPEEFWESFNRSSLPGLPPLSTATYDEILSSGNFGLIRNTNIRNVLNRHYSNNRARVVGMRDFAPSGYNTLFLSRFPHDVAYDAAIQKQFDRAKIVHGLQEMIRDPAFSAAANAEINFAIAGIETLVQLRVSTQRVIAQLDGQESVD